MWMLQLLATLRTTPLLAGAATSTALLATTPAASALVAVRNASGAPLVSAWADSVAGGERLVLEMHVASEDVVPAALLAIVSRALSASPPLTEWEPQSLSAPQLAAWQRAPAMAALVTAHTDGMTGPSDGRWLWMLALGMLGLEFLVRRRQSPPAEGHDAIG